jgi:hypothetical protein
MVVRSGDNMIVRQVLVFWSGRKTRCCVDNRFVAKYHVTQLVFVSFGTDN